MFHEQNFKRIFAKQQNAKLLSSSTQPFNYPLPPTPHLRVTSRKASSPVNHATVTYLSR